MRICGICETITNKEFCWRCEERSNRLKRAINKKLIARSSGEGEVKVNQPVFFKGRPIVQPGEVYEIDIIPHTVITATSQIIGKSVDGLVMTMPVYILENIETNERVYMDERELFSKFQDTVEVVQNDGNEFRKIGTNY